MAHLRVKLDILKTEWSKSTQYNERTDTTNFVINIPHEEYIGEDTQIFLLQLRLDREEWSFSMAYLLDNPKI